MNLYEACQTYVDVKVELNEIIKNKITAVENEYYEEAAQLFEQEKVVAKKLATMWVSLEFALAHPEKIGITVPTMISFRCSLLNKEPLENDFYNNMIFLRRIAMCSGQNPIHSRLLRSLNYLAIDYWTEFFIERKEWLEKRIKDLDLSKDQREILDLELKQIEHDMFRNPQ